MKPVTGDVRSLASWVVERTLDSKSSAERFFRHAEIGLDDRDRRLARELGLGTLRWLRRLDDVIEAASSRSLEAVDARLRAPLRVAAYQILFLDRIPAHAAVNEAVGEARRRTNRGGAGFANAVLRRIARSPHLEDWPVREQNPSRRLAIETSHPDFLVERWWQHFGEQRTRHLLAANNRRKPVQILVVGGEGKRDLVSSRLAKCAVTTVPSTLAPAGLVVTGGDPGETESWRLGEIYLQDVASQASALVPAPEAGHRVVDLAAAPGGKSFSLLAYEPGLSVVAADRSIERLQILRENRERLQLSMSLLLADGEIPPWRDSFDRVVLDLPCTGSGTLRKHPELKWRISSQEIERLSRQGLSMIGAAAGLVRPGGVIAVVTCSLEPEENSGMVSRFLEQSSRFERIDLAEELPPSLNSDLVDRGQWQILPGDVHDGFTVNALRRKL